MVVFGGCMPSIIHGSSGGAVGGGGGIKKILRGTYNGATSASVISYNIPLSETVVPQNCAILIYANDSAMGFHGCSVTEDTLIVRGTHATSLIYEVIEFEKVKSLQRGAFNNSSTVKTVTLNPVVMEKSLVLISAPYWMVAGRDLAEYNAFVLYYTWTNNTEIKIYSRSASDRGNPICWNVIEFD